MTVRYRRQNSALYYTRYHLVLVTKYRRKILRHGMGAYLTRIVHQLSRHHPDIQFIEVNTDQDHIHLLMSIPPKRSVASVVNLIKSNTGRAMRVKFPWLKKVYWAEDGIWSDGYFVSTVGVDEETIRNYIEHQGREDSGQAELELK
jgi:putative transposase